MLSNSERAVRALLKADDCHRLRPKGLSLRRVAEQAGCSIGKVQRLLRNKDAKAPEAVDVDALTRPQIGPNISHPS